MTAGSFDLLASVACVSKGRGKEDSARGRREESNAFPSLLPRAYFALLTRPKSFFPSISNARHRGSLSFYRFLYTSKYDVNMEGTECTGLATYRKNTVGIT